MIIRLENVPNHVFTEKDNGALVEVPRSSKITIELPENPAANHQWSVDGVDELFLASEGDAFLTGAQMGLSAGGVRKFFFRAKGSGCTSLSLTKKCTLQCGGQATDSFKLAVQIVK